jgi:hypothetical protein
MMSTVNAAPPPSEVRRTVAIDFLFLDLSACSRCSDSDANIETALAAVDGVLGATGAHVELRRIQVRSAEQARQLRFASSPTIRVNGRDIASERLESECGATGCGCGPGASCRLWSYRGRHYPSAPAGLIVDSILSELYGGTTGVSSPAAAYELPDNLARVFAAKDAGAPVGSGCCA